MASSRVVGLPRNGGRLASEYALGRASGSRARAGVARTPARREKLLEQSAEETLRRIRADAGRASQRLKPLLRTIARRLTDPDFNVTALWRDHGITDKAAASWFAEVGPTPRVYIEEARLGIAGWLLTRTRFPLWQVAQESGYACDATLCRAIKRRVDTTPDQYRRSRPPPESLVPDLEARVSCGLTGELVQRDGFSLLLEMEAMVERLRRFYDAGNLVPVLTSGADFEEYLVERKIWPEVADQPFERQRLLVRSCRLATPAFYEFLHRKSREEGRANRQRGLELAQLAFDSVGSLGGRYPNLQPQSRAWLGNARRLKLDFLGADRDVQQAVEQIRHSPDATTVGIVHWLKGTLRMTQRRQDDAIECFETAYSAFEQQGDSEWLIKTLLHKVTALAYAERHDEALQPLEEAAALLDPETEGTLSFTVEYFVVFALERAERFEAAAERIEALKRIKVDSDLWRCQVQWLDASIDYGLGRPAAESKFLSVLRGIESLDEPLYESLLLLDLVILFAERGRSAKVIEIAGGVLSVFSALRLSKETMASLKLLSDAISRMRVTTSVLKDFRACLRRDPLVDLGQRSPSAP